MNPYLILRLSPKAGDAEIRRAYLAELEKKGITPDMSYALAANDD